MAKLFDFRFVCRAAAVALIASTCWASVAIADSDAERSGELGSPSSRHDIVQGSHVEGHIAFLHAELGITPAQEPLWAPVAAAMREDVTNLQAARDNLGSSMPEGEDALHYLEIRTRFAKLHAEGETRFLAAFTPLYDNLSDRQKRMADQILIPRSSD